MMNSFRTSRILAASIYLQLNIRSSNPNFIQSVPYAVILYRVMRDCITEMIQSDFLFIWSTSTILLILPLIFKTVDQLDIGGNSQWNVTVVLSSQWVDLRFS